METSQCHGRTAKKKSPTHKREKKSFILVKASHERVSVAVRSLKSVVKVVRLLILRKLNVTSERGKSRESNNEQYDDLERPEYVLEP